MPPSASISITASPVIMRFGGMVFHVFYDDHIEPHVEVMVKGRSFGSVFSMGAAPGKGKGNRKGPQAGTGVARNRNARSQKNGSRHDASFRAAIQAAVVQR